MPNLKVMLDALQEAGVREQVKVPVGGAPVTAPHAEEVVQMPMHPMPAVQ